MRLSICILGQLPPLGFCLLTGKFVLTLRHTNRLYWAEAYYSAALTGQIGPLPCTDGLHQVKTYNSMGFTSRVSHHISRVYSMTQDFLGCVLMGWSVRSIPYRWSGQDMTFMIHQSDRTCYNTIPPHLCRLA